MSDAERVALVALAAAAVVASLVLFTPEDEDEPAPATTEATQPEPERTGTQEARPPRPEATRITIRNGRPVAGVRTIRAERGERVRVTVSVDAPDEVHLHGYDITREAAPGSPARFSFEADIEGQFELELHGSHSEIARLEVRPS